MNKINRISIYSFLMLSTLIVLSCSKKAKEQISFTIDHIIIDKDDPDYGYYLSVQPESKVVKRVLFLLPGFGQKAEDIFLDSSFHKFAHKHDILTIGFAGRTRLTADDLLQSKMNNVINHLKKSNGLTNEDFVLGGFSAGGTIALRYAELCNEFPDQFPIDPKGVFMVDSPVDMFHSWDFFTEILENKSSEIAFNEATWVKRFYLDHYGTTPDEDPEMFKKLSPFSIDKTMGENEQYLKDVAVRAYHDIDISWRIKNRNQTARFDNYIATSELINRLDLMGNQDAAFIQSFETGYRRNGERHPHSWSIVDPEDCVNWILEITE